MEHRGTAPLETKRLLLRRFKTDDARDMFNNWASDSEVTKYLVWPAYKNERDAADYLKDIVAGYEKPDSYNWAIELKSIGQAIGSIGAVSCNEAVGSVHIGYCIGKKWWNSGITSEAFAAVIKFFMEETGADRIESRHDAMNPNSGKVMKKCGLKYEGTLRRSDFNNQGVCDAVWYGLLREDYFGSDTQREYEISELVSSLLDHDDNRAHKCLLRLEEESALSPAVYKHFDTFVRMLGGQSSYVRIRGMRLIAANARWDKAGRVESALGAFLEHITDEKPITARQCIKLLPDIARYEPRLKAQITAALQNADTSMYKTSMKPLVEKDIVEALEKISRQE